MTLPADVGSPPIGRDKLPSVPAEYEYTGYTTEGDTVTYHFTQSGPHRPWFLPTWNHDEHQVLSVTLDCSGNELDREYQRSIEQY